MFLSERWKGCVLAEGQATAGGRGRTGKLTTFDDFLTTFDDVLTILVAGTERFSGGVSFGIRDLRVVAIPI
jgi:hypothetical protein